MASDIISWGEKACVLLSFWLKCHNTTWNSNDGYILAGNHLGGAILLSFAVECALKASLDAEGSPITKDLKIHNLHRLFCKLSPTTKKNTSNIYRILINADKDSRLRIASIDTLSACLKNHDRSFKDWRYNIEQAGTFYPVPMAYASVSLLTFIYPHKTFSVGSATSPDCLVLDGKVTFSKEQNET